MKLGKVLAEAALCSYKHVSFFPSYGAEMRGGTAHCFVKVSDKPISSPFISSPDIAVIFNQPSLDKFKKSFNKHTIVILNADLMQRAPAASAFSAPYHSFALNKAALRCGNIKVANSAALGMILSLTGNFLKRQDVASVLKKNFPEEKRRKQNLKALTEGENYAKG